MTKSVSEVPVKGEPDGWVAWHPEHGFMPFTDDGDLILGQDGESREHHSLFHPNSPAGKRQRKEGWRIRPVKLVFLDDTGGSDGE